MLAPSLLFFASGVSTVGLKCCPYSAFFCQRSHTPNKTFLRRSTALHWLLQEAMACSPLFVVWALCLEKPGPGGNNTRRTSISKEELPDWTQPPGWTVRRCLSRSLTRPPVASSGEASLCFGGILRDTALCRIMPHSWSPFQLTH